MSKASATSVAVLLACVVACSGTIGGEAGGAHGGAASPGGDGDRAAGQLGDGDGTPPGDGDGDGARNGDGDGDAESVDVGGDGDGDGYRAGIDPIDALADADLGAPEVPGTATYFCDCQPGAEGTCVPGSDSDGDGSMDSPYRTSERARTALLSSECGDAVLLCRGGSFDVWGAGAWMPNGETCEPGAYRKLGAYAPASGAEARPLVIGRRTYFQTISDTAGGGFEVESLNLRCEGCDADDGYRGFQFYGPQRNWLIEDVVMDGFGFAIQLGSDGQRPNSERIVVARSFVINSTQMGILGAADNMIVHDSVFRNNACMRFDAGQAQQCALDHAWYIDGGENVETGYSRFQNVTLRDSVFEDNCNVGSDGFCSCAVVVNRGQSNLLIEGNTFINNLDYEARCVAIDGTGTSSNRIESCLGCTIRNNQFLGGWTRAIQLNGSPDLLVENNVIQIAESARFPVHCAGIYVTDNRHGDGGDDEEAASDNLTIRNNSMYFEADLQDPGGGTEECTGVEIPDQGSSHVVVNNAIYLRGQADLDCFSIKAPSSDIEAMDHNLCERADVGAFTWNKAGEDLAQWQALTGLDGNSRREDPGFAAPGAAHPDQDFRASDGSAMVDRGGASHAAPMSIEGTERGGEPDVGAHER